MVELDLGQLGAAYYAANFHKWGCAPKGAAILWVRRDRQARVFPTVISHGYGAAPERRFRAQFDWTGTRDPTAALCIPVALDCIGALCPGGWTEVRTRNRELALSAGSLLCAALGLAVPAPDAMVGSLASVPLDRPALRREPGGQVELYHALFARGFEVLVQPWPDDSQLVVRVSAQLYNERAEYERLAQALVSELRA
jgi:isopenicillin-N epimerase